MTLTYGSLFAGAGGFDMGFDAAGFRCAWQVECERAAVSVLRRHWPKVTRVRDVCGFSRIPKRFGSWLDMRERVNVIVGGFPCQDVSVSGRRAGLSGSRSGLFYEFARIARGLQPDFVVWENVPGLLSSDGGRDFARIIDRLGECGYFGGWRVLDARYFGVAQRRRRVFGVFARHDLGAGHAAEILAITGGVSRHHPAVDQTEKSVAGTLGGGTGNRGWCDDTDRGTFVVSPTVTAKWSKGSAGPAGDECHAHGKALEYLSRGETIHQNSWRVYNVENGNTISGWVKLYHPRGPLVTLPVPVDPAAALGHVSAALDAGWLVAAPGLEPGEEKDTIGWICRREKQNNDGSIAHVLDLYIDNEQMKHRKMSIYLDSEDDVADFLYASALPTLEALPLFPATAPAERGKAGATDKYIVRMKTPIGFVYAPNPKYSADAAAAAKSRGEVYGVPKSKFVRWERVRPPVAGQSTEAGERSRVVPDSVPVHSAPGLADLNAELVRVGGSWPWAMKCIDKQYGTNYEARKAVPENVLSQHLSWFMHHVKSVPTRTTTPTAAELATKLTPAQATAEYDRQMKLVEQASTPADYQALRSHYARTVASYTERQARDLIEFIDAAEKTTTRSHGAGGRRQ